MHELKVEHRYLQNKPLSQDLACHLYKRSRRGKIVIVANKPSTMLSNIKKQWLRIIRKTQIKRSSTLRPERIIELTEQISYMRNLTFVARPPEDTLEAVVTIATANDFAKIAPDCATMYVTCNLSTEMLQIITSWMPRGGLVVIYG